MLLYLIDSKKVRDVATIEITGAFMHVDMEAEVNMKLEGTMADLFSNINPQIYK